MKDWTHMKSGMKMMLLSVACSTIASGAVNEGDNCVKAGRLTVVKGSALNVRIDDEAVIVNERMPYAHLTDTNQTVVQCAVIGDTQVLNVHNLTDPRFKYRREVALHPDGSIELTSRMRLAPYTHAAPSIAYEFSVPISLLAGATFKAWVGKSAATKAETGAAGQALSGIRYIAFSGGKKDLVFDFNPYGVTDWQDYTKWGFPTGCWSMSSNGKFITFAYGRSATFFGGTVAGKVIIREGAWDYDARHPYDTFSYHGSTPPRKRYVFGTLAEGLVPADTQTYTPDRTWGWEKTDGLTLVDGEGRSVLDHCAFSPSGAGNAFLIDVPPGYYVVTARFCHPKADTGPFDVVLNGTPTAEGRAITLRKQEPRTLLLQAYAKEGKLRVAFSGANGWCINSLAVQTLIYRNEDYFLSRKMWLTADAPDVDDEATASLAVAVPSPGQPVVADRSAPADVPAEDWRWTARTTHFGISVYDTRDCLISPEEIERRMDEIKGEGYTAVMLDGWHMWTSFQDRLDRWTESTRRRVDAAHKQGLKVIDHFDVPCVVYGGTGFDFLIEHLDWAQRDIRFDEPTFRMMCINNPGFRRKFLDFLERYARTTGIDGVMLDECTFSGKDFCGCRHCREAFTKDTGLTLPTQENAEVFFNEENPLWAQWLRWRMKSVGDWWLDVKATLAGVRPGLSIMMYTTHYGFSDRWAPLDLGFDLIENARGCDFLGTEIMTRNILDSYRSVFAYRKMKSAVGRRFGAPIFGFVYPVGNPDFAYFGWALQHMNNQVAISATIPGSNAERYINWPWQMVKSRAESVADTAVLFSRNSRDFGRMMNHRNDALGFSESLSDAHIQHDFVLDEDITSATLSRYKLLILPTVMCTSTGQVATIREFVAAGGRLLCSGNTSLFNENGFSEGIGLQLGDVLGIDCATNPPMVTAESIRRDDAADLIPYPGTALVTRCRPDSGAKISAQLKDKNGADLGPALIEHAFGKGRTVYLPWTPGGINCEHELRLDTVWTYARNDPVHEYLIDRVQDLLPAPGFQAVAIPEKVRVSVFRQPDPEARLMVHLLNATGMNMKPGQKLTSAHPGPAFPALPADLVFDIQLPQSAKAFVVSPDYEGKRAVKLEPLDDGRSRVTVRAGDVRTYGMVLFVNETENVPQWDDQKKGEDAMRKTGSTNGMAALAVAVGMQGMMALGNGNLMPNPSAEAGDRFPSGWGRWKGAGDFDWGITQDTFYSGNKCAYLTVTKFGEVNGQTQVGGALLAGGELCKGVTGEMALACEPNTTYTFSFWAKGTVPWTDVKVLGWKTEAAAKTDREAIVTTVGRIRPEAEWKQHVGTFRTTDMTRRCVLAFYVIGNEDEGMSVNKTLYIDDITLEAKPPVEETKK